MTERREPLRRGWRRVLALALLLAAAAALAPALARGRPGVSGSDEARPGAAAAAIVYSGLRDRFRVGDRLYRDGEPDSGAYSAAWPLSQALAAAISLARDDRRYLPEVRTLLAGLERYWDGTAYESTILPPYGPGGDVYFDDNEWVALDLLDASRLLHEPALAARARGIFAVIVGGWDSDATHRCPGGVFWGRGNGDRDAVSTENAALLALRIGALDRRPSYLAWARRLDGWVSRCLRRRDGLIMDGIAADGTLDPTVYTYNQGAAIAVDTLLAQRTGDASYLRRARQTAQAELRRPHDLRADPPAFVAIFFRDLALLPGAPTGPARRYAASLWPRRGTGTLLDESALADLLARYGAAAE